MGVRRSLFMAIAVAHVGLGCEPIDLDVRGPPTEPGPFDNPPLSECELNGRQCVLSSMGFICPDLTEPFSDACGENNGPEPLICCIKTELSACESAGARCYPDDVICPCGTDSRRELSCVQAGRPANQQCCAPAAPSPPSPCEALGYACYPDPLASGICPEGLFARPLECSSCVFSVCCAPM
jgi:hypothetical protein